MELEWVCRGLVKCPGACSGDLYEFVDDALPGRKELPGRNVLPLWVGKSTGLGINTFKAAHLFPESELFRSQGSLKFLAVGLDGRCAFGFVKVAPFEFGGTLAGPGRDQLPAVFRVEFQDLLLFLAGEFVPCSARHPAGHFPGVNEHGIGP